MTKAEFINEFSNKTNFTKKDSTLAVDAVIDCITEALGRNESVNFVGFGSFKVKERAARTLINPSTKKPMKLKATKVVSFKPGKTLKETVKKTKKSK